MEKKKIAVIGAGVMGSDVAFDFSSYGYSVILKDIDEKVIEAASDKIKKDFSLYKMVKPDLMKNITIDDILKNIKFTTKYDDFDSVDMVVENVTEDWQAKKNVYCELRGVCKAGTIYGVNTSCFSITKIGSLLPEPDKVIGIHLMNPVPMKAMVEVIRGYSTTESTIEIMNSALKSLGKTPIVVEDFPGFVTNRVMMLMINECVWTVQDGVAKPRDVDKIFRLGFGHKMGPLATADLIGLDTILNSLIVLYESYNDPKFRPCPLLRKMVDAGLLGKKSGKGFFEYK